MAQEMQKAPQETGVPVDVFADEMDVSPRTVRRWRKDGILVLDENGDILLEASSASVKARIDFSKRPGMRRGDEPPDAAASRLLQARADKEEALADLRRMEADEASGELMPVADCAERGRIVGSVFMSWINRFPTVTMPKIMPYVRPEIDQFLIRTILQEEAERLQKDIHNEILKMQPEYQAE